MPFRPRGRSQTTFKRRRIVNIVCERPPMLPEKLNAGHAQAVHSGIGLAMQKCFEYATDRHCTVERVPLRAGKPEAFSQKLSEKFLFQYKACLD